MARRYKIGLHPVYDSTYDRLKAQSIIKNPTRASVTNFRDIQSKDGLELRLREWKGFYNKDEEWIPGYVELAEERIKDIEAEFEIRCQRAINAGRSRPKDYPSDLQERMYQAEARYDLISDEWNDLQKRLKQHKDAEQKQEVAAVLRRGPKGSGRLQGGILVEVDGQTVKADSDGILRIQDERSPYNGLETYRYFEEVCKPWESQNRKLRREYEQKVKAGEIDPQQTPKPRAPLPECPQIKQEKEAV